jgi:hypothetical protein
VITAPAAASHEDDVAAADENGDRRDVLRFTTKKKYRRVSEATKTITHTYNEAKERERERTSLKLWGRRSKILHHPNGRIGQNLQT